MAYWDAQDSDSLLLRRWLAAFRLQHSLPFIPAESAMPGDTEYNTLTKILRSYCTAFSIAADSTLRFQHLDSENTLLRKILTVFHEGVPSLPDDAGHSWRPGDGDRDILAKILRCLSIDAANTDVQLSFLPMDSEVWCLRKIVGLF